MREELTRKWEMSFDLKSPRLFISYILVRGRCGIKYLSEYNSTT